MLEHLKGRAEPCAHSRHDRGRNMKKPPSKPSAGNWPWPPTEWSASGHIPKLCHTDPERLKDLILKYRTPLKAYLLAAFPAMEDQAEEFLQDFVEDRILKKGWLDKAERERGRFRDFLKISLKNFVRDRLRAQRAEAVSMDGLSRDVPAEESGSEAFDLEWARAILAEVLRRMEIDCRRPRRNQANHVLIWETFRLRLVQPILEGTEPIGYQELVSRLGIVSPSAAQNLLVTAKRICCRHLNAVISEYAQADELARAELRDLRQFLGGLTRRKNEKKIAGTQVPTT